MALDFRAGHGCGTMSLTGSRAIKPEYAFSTRPGHSHAAVVTARILLFLHRIRTGWADG
jgi:hypothetical protein